MKKENATNMSTEMKEALKAVEEFEKTVNKPEQEKTEKAGTKKTTEKKTATEKTAPKKKEPDKKQELIPDVKKEFKRRTGIIGREINRIEESYVSIAFQLYWIREKKAYKFINSKNVYEFAENEFNIKKSTCGNLIGIIENFSKKDEAGNALEELDERYREFKMSQLVAMLSMSDKARIEITPDMSVRAINQEKKKCKRVGQEEKETGKTNNVIDGKAREIKRTVFATFQDYHQYQSRLEDTDQQVEKVFNAYEKKGKKVIVEVSYTELD